MLPKAVMEKAQSEFLDWHGTGLSVMDFSHRGEEFQSIAKQSEADLREILAIPDNYRVLFCSGGATFQFAMIAMNCLRTNAVYVDTGIWSSKAIKEAKKYGEVSVVDALVERDGLYEILPESEWQLPEQFDYLHFTPNETIGGVEFPDTPKVARGKLIADMSSNILSRQFNVEDYALIYAGAQKNIGPAGLTIVIVREDIIEKSQPDFVPSLMQYSTLADNDSMFNTPPTYSWYLAGLVFDWIKNEGGLVEMQRRASERSQLLYDFIDNSDFYHNPIYPTVRSRMNIPFTLSSDDFNELFLTQAASVGLVNLKGHRSVGGMRASLYNAMPVDGVKSLIEFLEIFSEKI